MIVVEGKGLVLNLQTGNKAGLTGRSQTQRVGSLSCVTEEAEAKAQ